MSLYWEHIVITCSSVSGSLRAQKWQILCSGVKAGLLRWPVFIVIGATPVLIFAIALLCFWGITIFRYCSAWGENLKCLYVLVFILIWISVGLLSLKFIMPLNTIFCLNKRAQALNKYERTNFWTEAIDKGLLNGVIFLDLRKTFDLIDNKILLKKLQMYKCSDATMTWFTSYLYERNQCTSFKGKSSNKLSIKTGVPQGSILGP